MNNRVQIDVVFLICIALFILHNLRLPQQLLIVYCLAHFLFFCKNPGSPLNANQDADPIALHALYRDGFIFLGMSLLLIIQKPKVRLMLRVATVLEAICLVLYATKISPSSGFAGSPSIDACFIAIGSYYFTGWKRVALSAAAMCTIATAPAVTIILMNLRKKDIRIAVLASLAIATFFLLKLDFTTYSGDRVMVWKQSFEYIVFTKRWLLGAGLGSYNALGELFTDGTTLKFLAAHNEYLQLFFEYGVLGLIVFAIAAVDHYRHGNWHQRRVYLGLIWVCITHSVFRQGALFILFLL